jgi:hypothetical protein
MTQHSAINPPPCEEAPSPRRARALLSTSDFRLLRAALASHVRNTTDPAEVAQINALFHRLGAYD